MRAWSRSRKSLAAVRALRSSRLAPNEQAERDDFTSGIVSSSEGEESSNDGDETNSAIDVRNQKDHEYASTSSSPRAERKYVSRYHEKKSRMKFKTLATVLPTSFDSNEAKHLREQAKRLHEGGQNMGDSYLINFAAKGPGPVERSLENRPWIVLLALVSIAGIAFVALGAVNGFDASKAFSQENRTHVVVQVYDSLLMLMVGCLVTAVFSVAALNLSSSRIFVHLSPYFSIFIITLAFVYFGVRLYFGGNWGILQGSALYLSDTLKVTSAIILFCVAGFYAVSGIIFYASPSGDTCVQFAIEAVLGSRESGSVPIPQICILVLLLILISMCVLGLTWCVASSFATSKSYYIFAGAPSIIIATLWLWSFMLCVLQGVVAGCIAEWYWTEQPRAANLTQRNLSASFYRIVSHHLGDLALAPIHHMLNFPQSIAEFLRRIYNDAILKEASIDELTKFHGDDMVIVEEIYNSNADSDRLPWWMALFCYCRCVSFVYARDHRESTLMRHFGCVRYSILSGVGAVAQTAIKGTPIVEASQLAGRSIYKNLRARIVLDGASNLFELWAFAATCVGICSVDYLIFSVDIPLMGPTLLSASREPPLAVILFGLATCGAVARALLGSTIASIYALLLCYVDDLDRNDGSVLSPYCMPDTFKDFLLTQERKRGGSVLAEFLSTIASQEYNHNLTPEQKQLMRDRAMRIKQEEIEKRNKRRMDAEGLVGALEGPSGFYDDFEVGGYSEQVNADGGVDDFQYSMAHDYDYGEAIQSQSVSNARASDVPDTDTWRTSYPSLPAHSPAEARDETLTVVPITKFKYRPSEVVVVAGEFDTNPEFSDNESDHKITVRNGDDADALDDISDAMSDDSAFDHIDIFARNSVGDPSGYDPA